MDAFVFVHDASVHCTIDKSKCEFCLNYADKVMADNLEFSVGGNAANTAVTFARLGLSSQLYSMVGTDWIGERIVTALKDEKIDCRYLQEVKGATSYATAIVFQGERNLIIYHVPRDYHLPAFEPTDWVYLTSMGKAYATAYESTIHFVKKHQLKLSFNPGSYQLRAGITQLKPILAVTEVLFVNKEEAQLLTELPASATIRQLSEALYEHGPKIIAITDGPRGAYAFDGEQLLSMDIFPAEVVERTGAGDAYASGFTAGLLHGHDIAEAMRWGMANSAGVVAAIGPQAGILTKDRLNEMLNDNHTIAAKKVR